MSSNVALWILTQNTQRGKYKWLMIHLRAVATVVEQELNGASPSGGTHVMILGGGTHVMIPAHHPHPLQAHCTVVPS